MWEKGNEWGVGVKIKIDLWILYADNDGKIRKTKHTTVKTLTSYLKRNDND